MSDGLISVLKMTCYFRFDSKHRPVLMWVSHMRTLQVSRMSLFTVAAVHCVLLSQHPRVHGRNFGAGQLSAARSHTPVVSISIQNDPPPEPTVRAHPCQVMKQALLQGAMCLPLLW